jgi:hypothetical protein
MKLGFNFALLESLGCERSYILRRLEGRLGISRTAASLRLDRVRGDATGINRAILIELLQIAKEYGVSYEEFLLLEPRSVFDLLPRESSLIYLNDIGYKVTKPSPTRTFSTAVADHFAARRIGRRVNRRLSIIRFAPRAGAEVERLQAFTDEKLKAARKAATSLVAIGSAKSNPVCEALVCHGIGVTPFHRARPGVVAPYCLHFPPRFAGSLRSRDEAPLPNVGYFTTVVTPGLDTSEVDWCGMHDFSYGPPESAWTSEEGKNGIDYAVVSVEGLVPEDADKTFAWVTVAGLSGIGTYGATALLCDHPDDFALPGVEGAFFRAYLVRVEFSDPEPGVQLKEPRWAAVLDHWTRTNGLQGRLRDENEEEATRREGSTARDFEGGRLDELLREVRKMPPVESDKRLRELAESKQKREKEGDKGFVGVLKEFAWRRIR